MRIKGIYNFSTKDYTAPVDRWRIDPIKKIGGKIQLGIVQDPSDKGLEKAVEQLKDQDIVYSSYYTNKSNYALTCYIADKYKTKFVLDVDDNIYKIPQHNPIWLKKDIEDMWGAKIMIEDVPYVTTTNERLAEFLRKQRGDKPVYVIPNYIDLDLYKNEGPKNGDRVVIGYFGGSSHYMDINRTGVLNAIIKLQRKYEHVDFVMVGDVHNAMTNKLGLEVKPLRFKQIDGVKGEGWYDLFSTLSFDISLGPLVPDIFNEGKSNIKWQESSIMGSAFVCSKVGPYRDLKNVRHTINNPEGWYNALEELILDEKKRKNLAKKSKEDVVKNWSLENNVDNIRKVFQEICDS